MGDILEEGETKGVFVLRQQINIDAQRLQLWPSFCRENSCQLVSRVGPAFEAGQVFANLEEFKLEITALVLKIVVGENPLDILGVEVLRLGPVRPFVQLEAPTIPSPKVRREDDGLVDKRFDPDINWVNIKSLQRRKKRLTIPLLDGR